MAEQKQKINSSVFCVSHYFLPEFYLFLDSHGLYDFVVFPVFRADRIGEITFE